MANAQNLTPQQIQQLVMMQQGGQGGQGGQEQSGISSQQINNQLGQQINNQLGQQIHNQLGQQVHGQLGQQEQSEKFIQLDNQANIGQDYNQNEDMKDFADKVSSQIQNNENNMQFLNDDAHQQMLQQQLMHQQMTQQNNKLSLKKDLMGKIQKDFKEPLLVAIIFVILNNPIVSKQIAKYMPQIINNDKVSNVGILLLGLLSGVLFYISKCFIAN